MPAADMLQATYGGGKYLRRWALIGGYPRCILPALSMAEADPFELDATLTENARLYDLVREVEAYEAAVQLTSGKEAPPETLPSEEGPQPNPARIAWNNALAAISAAKPEVLGLVARRAEDWEGEPVVVALVCSDGKIANVVAVDSDWQPEAPVTTVLAGEGARAGGTYLDGVFSPPTQVWSLEDYQAAVATHVEEVAQARQYSSAASCAGYATSTVPGWAAEAQTFIAWRDEVYLAVYAQLAEVQAGAPAPALQALIDSLPIIAWPA